MFVSWSRETPGHGRAGPEVKTVVRAYRMRKIHNPLYGLYLPFVGNSFTTSLNAIRISNTRIISAARRLPG